MGDPDKLSRVGAKWVEWIDQSKLGSLGRLSRLGRLAELGSSSRLGTDWVTDTGD